MKKEIAKNFLEMRNSLIEQLERGEIDKTKFIEMTYDYIRDTGFKPFKNSNKMTVEEGLCNYQYYNIIAKKLLIDAEEVRFKDGKESYRLYNEAQDNYRKKEETTMALLEVLNYENISAYPINMTATHLSGEMVEIIVLNRDKAIFHTLDKLIIGRLRRNNVFDENCRESVINNYVNKKYTY